MESSGDQNFEVLTIKLKILVCPIMVLLLDYTPYLLYANYIHDNNSVLCDLWDTHT
jgi:hypothetical protein